MKMPETFRILCLHGFTSNGAVHAYQARKITSLFSNPSSAPGSPKYEFLFPDGPHIVADADIKDTAWRDYVAKNSTSGHRAWWFARDSNLTTEDAFVNPETGGYYGLEESVKYVGEIIEREGPLHAIWGFSQGACFAGMLMALLSELSKDPLELRKYLPKEQGSPMAGVFFSGFRARFERYHSLYQEGIQRPTLHVVGENDVLVSVERSRTFEGLCEGPEELRHHNGHNIPRSEEEVERVAAFLRRNVK